MEGAVARELLLDWKNAQSKSLKYGESSLCQLTTEFVGTLKRPQGPRRRWRSPVPDPLLWPSNSLSWQAEISTVQEKRRGPWPRFVMTRLNVIGSRKIPSSSMC